MWTQLAQNVDTMDVGIRELKQNLSKYLARVREGETVTVTDRGTPVARLEPIRTSELPARVQELIKSRELNFEPVRPLPPPRLRLSPGEKTFSDYVAEQRR